MEFTNPVFEGKILKRYKRFLADIELEGGELITAHTANTGAMTSCWEPGWKSLVSFHDNPKRKLKYSLEMTHNGESWIGVNTSLPNMIVLEALKFKKITELSAYDTFKPEHKVGKSRLDIFLTDSKGSLPDCYLEVKNVTLKVSEGHAQFPDAVSTRGQKHLEELIQLKKQGHECVMFYLVQRQDIESFSPAESIDPEYSRLLKEAKKVGVKILVYNCRLSPKEIKIHRALKLVF